MKMKKRQKIQDILAKRGWRTYWQWNLDDAKEDGSYSADPPITSEVVMNLFGSQNKDGLHRPTLDIDVPAWLVPSATPGHSHLYIDVQLTWRQYGRLLDVLDECGIIETGYVDASLAKGGSFVRLPTVLKPEPPKPLF